MCIRTRCNKDILQKKLIAFYTQPVLAFWTNYVFRNSVEEITEERKKLDSRSFITFFNRYF